MSSGSSGTFDMALRSADAGRFGGPGGELLSYEANLLPCERFPYSISWYQWLLW